MRVRYLCSRGRGIGRICHVRDLRRAIVLRMCGGIAMRLKADAVPCRPIGGVAVVHCIGGRLRCKRVAADGG